MFITLHRSGPRALFVRAGTPLAEIPLHIVHWLGPIDSSSDAELDTDTPMLGVKPMAILKHIRIHGFCTLDAPNAAPRQASTGEPG